MLLARSSWLEISLSVRPATAPTIPSARAYVTVDDRGITIELKTSEASQDEVEQIVIPKGHDQRLQGVAETSSNGQVRCERVVVLEPDPLDRRSRTTQTMVPFPDGLIWSAEILAILLERSPECP